MAFSSGIVTDLLRRELGFKGYVNYDTGLVGERAWGLEDLSIEEQLVIMINAGTDVLSGFDDKDVILNLLEKGEITEERIDTSVRRLLKEQFELGLFEDPYVDPDRAAYLVGNRAYQAKAEEAQRKSIVLLENRNDLLPIASPTEEDPVILYTMGMDPDVVSHEKWYGYEVVSGDYDAEKAEDQPGVPNDTDYAIIRVNVTNKGAGMFGGAISEELNALSFTEMAKAKSWEIFRTIEDIQAIMEEVGPDKTILSIYFRQPFVIDEASGMREAGAILATFGVRDAAIMDLLTGNYSPQGKPPFSLTNRIEAVIEQAPDAPGYPQEHILYPFGYGLRY